MNRRRFLLSAGGTSLIGCFPADLSSIERQQTKGRLERRALGKTGEKLSIIGFGGIVVTNASTQQAAERVREAIEAGVNYFDVAPTYGNAEDMLGPALQPYRKGVFLACKTTKRTRQEAAEELERSLQKLKTDHFDLYQHHGVTEVADVKQLLGPNGAMETFLKAKKEGKIRFIGFSAHSVEAATALMDGFAFDSILFPVNYATWHAGHFGPQVLAKAQQKGMGILCLKAMAKQPWPKGAKRTHAKCWYEPFSQPEEAELALRFTLSHPVTAAVPPGDENVFRMALALGAKFRPLTAPEAEKIKQQALTTEPLFRYPRQA